MNRIAFLAVGLLAGGICGYFLGGGSSGERARATPRARVEPPPREIAPSLPEASAPSGDAPPPPSPASRREAPRDDLAPSTPLAAGFGRLEVDCGGREVDPWVLGQDMWGETATVGFEEEDSEVRGMDLRPGDYEVLWWEESGLSECYRAARVEAGKVTRVTIGGTASEEDFAIPARLARLDVTVRALDGMPYPALIVAVSGMSMNGMDEAECDSSDEGLARFHLLPGAYTVVLGTRRVPVVLVEGEAAAMEFRYDREGEVLVHVSGASSGVPFNLRRKGGPSDDWIQARGAENVFPYLAPGEYEVAHIGGRIVGLVAVAPRRISPFAWEAPGGGILVKAESAVEPDEARVLYRGPGLPDGLSTEVRWSSDRGIHSGTAWLAFLQPGRYGLRFEADGFLPETKEVDVGASLVEVTFRPALDPAAPRDR